MKVAVINYGMGNLGSVRRALADLKADVFIAEQPGALWEASRIILPGVGGFSEGAAHLHEQGWTAEIRRQVQEQGKPLLGICLGMQLLATTGEEGGASEGLQLIPGTVRKLDSAGCTLRIPHVGWNDISPKTTSPLLTHIGPGTDFYFVHSYVFAPDRNEDVLATTTYGAEVTAVVGRGNVFGTQFHPEKSSRAGRALLQNFLDYAPC